eukprot:4426391-Pyramimonas_sp.AAC.1
MDRNRLQRKCITQFVPRQRPGTQHYPGDVPNPAQTRGANSLGHFIRGGDDGARVTYVCRRTSGDSQGTGFRTWTK